MNNYFYPGFTSMWQNPTNASTLGSITKKSINWSSIISGVQKTLNIANQAIPVFHQIRPIWNNAKTLFRVFSEFNKIPKKDSQKASTLIKEKNETNIIRKVENKSNGRPQFFL